MIMKKAKPTILIILGSLGVFLWVTGDSSAGDSNKGGSAKIGPYSIPAKYRLGFLAVVDKRPIVERSSNPSIVPSAILSLSDIARVKCEGIKDDILAVSLIYYIDRSDPEKLGGVILGIEGEGVGGKIVREMYRFDVSEEEFVADAIAKLNGRKWPKFGGSGQPSELDNE